MFIQSILLKLFLLVHIYSCAQNTVEPFFEKEADCEVQGGRWEALGDSEIQECNLPTMDGGEMCDDSSQCQSACLTDGSILAGTEVTGVCYSWSFIDEQCVNMVIEGIAEGEVCE